MNEPTMTIVGKLVADPALRATLSRTAGGRFRVASTPCYYDRTAGGRTARRCS
jgi:single-stranded DNA-binding protein